MPKSRVRRRPAAVVALPKLSPHWHPPGCDCEPTRPYIRVSKVGTRELVISPDLQLRAIESWARDPKNKKRLLEPYCDINKSGRTFRKRSVGKIIKEIEAGQYKHVTLWKWSRWARNTEESAKYTKQIQDAGGWVASATEDIDQKTAIGKLQLGILREFDQYTSNLMEETWKGVHARRREAGLPHGGRERFGYDYVEVRNETGQLVEKRYEIIDDEADILRKAYALYNDRKSFDTIVAYFKTMGATTTFGGQWTAQGAARMMDTGFAAGFIRERSVPKDKPSNSIRDYDVWRGGSHTAIVDRETWRVYKDRRLLQAGALPPRAQRAVHGLSALLFCSQCRRRMVTKYAGAGRTHQWQCPWKNSFHPAVSVTVNNRLTLVVVREWVRDQYGSELPVAPYVDAAYELIAQKETQKANGQKKIQDQIGVLESKIDNLVELASTAPGLAKERYTAKIQTWSAEVEVLLAQLAVAPEKQAVKNYDALRSLDEVWDELPPAVLRDSLATLISRIEVSPRTASSTRKSVTDRVRPVGSWEEPDLAGWLVSRPT